MNNWESVAKQLHSIQPDIVFGTESWENGSRGHTELLPSHLDIYDVWRKDRGDGDGGVLLATRKELITTTELHFDVDCEVIWAKLKFSSTKVVYVGTYCHPHHNDVQGLMGLGASMSKLPRDACKILPGDFKLPDATEPVRRTQLTSCSLSNKEGEYTWLILHK